MYWGTENLPGDGATFVISDPGNGSSAGFQIDWNGDEGPNTLGDDELYVYTPYANLSYWYTSPYKQFTYWDDVGPNAALRDQILAP